MRFSWSLTCHHDREPPANDQPVRVLCPVRGKDVLLATGIEGPFSVLANTLKSDDLAGLTGLLDHFRANRARACSILRDPIRRRVVVVLTTRIEAILDARDPWKRGPLILPARLAAIQLSEMLLAPVTAWLTGQSRCSSQALATALRRVSVAALDVMTVANDNARR